MNYPVSFEQPRFGILIPVCAVVNNIIEKNCQSCAQYKSCRQSEKSPPCGDFFTHVGTKCCQGSCDYSVKGVICKKLMQLAVLKVLPKQDPGFKNEIDKEQGDQGCQDNAQHAPVFCQQDVQYNVAEDFGDHDVAGFPPEAGTFKIYPAHVPGF